MKLETIFAISMALALPTAVSAQNPVDDMRDMTLVFGIDPSGVDLAATRGYAEGTTILLVSLGKAEAGNELPIPAALGGGEIGLAQPFFVLSLDQADEQGNHHQSLGLDSRALANAGLTVYVQAFSINSSDWPGVEPEPTETGPAPILISEVVTVDFHAGMAEWDAQNEQGQGGSGGGAESPDGSNGTEPEEECRCPVQDDDAEGRDGAIK